MPENNSKMDNSNQSSENFEKEIKAIYKLSIETGNFEINNLIQRNNFYMLFQGVLLASVFSSQASKPNVESLICLSGVFISWFQIKSSAGAKYWQEYWELKTSEIEKRLKELHPNKEGFQTLFQFKDNDDFKKNLNEHLESKNYGKFSKLLVDKLIKNPSSVSMAPLYTAIILFLTWIFLFLQTINFYWLENIIPINLIEGLYFKGQN